MKTLIRNILITLAALLGLSYLVFAAKKGTASAGELVCSEVIVSITDYDKKQLINDKEIATLLSESKLQPIGKPMSAIKVKDIEDELSKHPMIRNIECFKTPGGMVKLKIEQRNPVLRVAGREDYYVDDLRQITPISDMFTVYVPVVTGRVNRSAAKEEIYDFIQFLNKNTFWNDQIEQIHIDDNQQVQLIPRVGNHLIILGNFDRYEQKLEKLRKFYLYGLNETGWNAYSKIDLSYRDQVVCTHR